MRGMAPDPAAAEFAVESLPAFRRALKEWYARRARPLPWRASRDPYRIWISEIMLQQTTVAAVIPYFERFLARFPGVEDLAAADEQDVLRLWEGLGYYSRARNLHRAARVIARDLQGVFPDDVESLCRLPGIGRYTAGAIASFAFDRPAPIVEANTLRLYCRLLAYEGDPRSAAGQRALWSLAEILVPGRSPGQFNQALMELGGTLCTPKNPDCPNCPVAGWCRAFALGRQAEVPRAAMRPAVSAVSETAVAVKKTGRWLMRQRPAGERWAGLWDFVRFAHEIDSDSPRGKRAGHFERGVRADLARRVNEHSGVQVEIGDKFAELRHSVTRYRITLSCFSGTWRAGRPSHGFRWISPASLGELPLSVTARRIARLLEAGSSK
jgi:A/G-specific adenine glycosylase